jgi:hypothetical protein
MSKLPDGDVRQPAHVCDPPVGAIGMVSEDLRRSFSPLAQTKGQAVSHIGPDGEQQREAQFTLE